MNVILVSANQERRRITAPKNSRQVFVQFCFNRRRDERLSVFCAEDKVNEN